jgi:DNA processing protein
MTHAGACPQCLRRSWLVSLAAPYIEKTLGPAPSASALELFCLSDEALVETVAPKDTATLLARIESLPESYFTDELKAANCWATCRHDPFYPESLREAPDVPCALIARGKPALLIGFDRQQTVTIVGARRATTYGRGLARTLGHDLAAAGLTVVSGLSFGIDSSVLRGSLEAGRTISVFASGPDVAIPAAHRTLWRKVSDRGLIVSELAPGAGAAPWTFSARNRIMAALAGMTVVVEAKSDSGSLLTADVADRLGRELGAVPGPAHARLSIGTNALLAEGAHLVRDAQDVLDVLGDSPGPVDRAADLTPERP